MQLCNINNGVIKDAEEEMKMEAGTSFPRAGMPSV